MAMKKIKPKFGKVVPPAVEVEEQKSIAANKKTENKTSKNTISKNKSTTKQRVKKKPSTEQIAEETSLTTSSNPNPFLQSKEVLKQTDLTKIGYRMRSEYVELLDIQKKLKKGGYTLEAVLDDALTYYFEHSDEGKEAKKKAQIFYS